MGRDRERRRPAPEAAMAECEAAVGVRLPNWLRERLHAENGFSLDDSAGTTGQRWTILPVRDRSDRKRMIATAEDIARATEQARAVDRIATPGFGAPEPGHPFPPEGVVIGYGWSPMERLALLPDPEDPGRLGTMLHRQHQFLEIASLGVTLEEFAPDPLSFDTGEPLPHFRYHPDPVATGAVGRSGKRCDCCGRVRGWVSRVSGRERAICPWCIADGSARAGIGGFDIDGRVPPSVAEELMLRTPGYMTWQQGRWLTHCGDAAAFLGYAGWDRLQSLPDACAAIVADGYDERVLPMLTEDGDFVAYLFRCLQCGTHLAYADAS